MHAHASNEDRRYCRDVLPQVSRTFAINIRLLHGEMGETVRVGYLLCRIADALEDSWPGEPAAIAGRFETLTAAIDGSAGAAETLADGARDVAGGRADMDLVAHLPHVWRVYQALDAPRRDALGDAVRTMAAGMSRYASRAAGRDPGVPYLDTEHELHDYCFVVAGCVGVMLTRLANLASPAAQDVEARRLELAPVVGEALQLTNILLDWPSDIRKSRCHVPAAWLDEFSFTPSDLVGSAKPGVAELSRRLETLAQSALRDVPAYVDLFPARMFRYRVFCLWPALWAIGSLRHARQDPEFPWGPRRPRLPKQALTRTALEGLFAGHNSSRVHHLYEREMSALAAPV